MYADAIRETGEKDTEINTIKEKVIKTKMPYGRANPQKKKKAARTVTELLKAESGSR